MDTATSLSKTRENSSGYLIKNRLTAEANAAFQEVSPSSSLVLLTSFCSAHYKATKSPRAKSTCPDNLNDLFQPTLLGYGFFLTLLVLFLYNPVLGMVLIIVVIVTD